MAQNETPLSLEQPRSTFGTWLGVVLLFAVFGLFVWVVVGAMPRGDRYEEKRSQARLEKFKTAHEEAQTSLHTYGWVDKEKGVARIPIDRAMELSVAELVQHKPAPAGPIATPAAPAPGPQEAAPAVPSPAPKAAAQSPTGTPVDQISHSGEGSVMGGQPTGAANPAGAAPGTQPGASSTPAAGPPAPAEQAPLPPSERGPTPTQNPPGTPLPVRPEHP